MLKTWAVEHRRLAAKKGKFKPIYFIKAFSKQKDLLLFMFIYSLFITEAEKLQN